MSSQNTASTSVRLRVDRPGAAGTPAAGDVIVRREGDSSRGRYSLREHPAEPQVLCSSRESALQIGGSFARARGVALWDDDGTSLTRLPVARPRTGPRG